MIGAVSDADDEKRERRLPMPDWAAHHATLRAAFQASDSYALLLGLLLIDFMLLAGLPDSPWAALLRVPFVVVTLLLALRTSHAPHRLVRVARIAAAIGVIAAVASAFGDANHARGGGSLIFVVLLAATPIVILRRIMSHPEVTTETILGALCVYLMIGLVFASLFNAVNSLGSEYFAVPYSQNQPADLQYLSFITLTTVGFGDVVANTDFGRSLVVLEALIGQIFLVTLVARLVAGFGSERRRVSSGPDDAGDAGDD
jgi:voltage-gated potassium channel Kch